MSGDALAERRQVEARVLRDFATLLDHQAGHDIDEALGREVVRAAATMARSLAKSLGVKGTMTVRGLAAEYRLAEQADDSEPA